MNQFEYEAVCANGAAMSGAVEASDQAAAMAQLVGLGLQNVRIARQRAPLLRRPIRADDFIFFNEQLAALASSGIALEQGLRQLARDVGSSRLRGAIEGIASDLERGISLDEAVGRRSQVLPPLYGRVIRAGLANGHLSSTLLNLSNHMRFLVHTRRLVIQALAYPALVCVLAAAVMGAILYWVVPQFEDISTDFAVETSGMTQMLILLSHGLPEMLTVLGGLAIVTAVVFGALGLTTSGRVQRERIVITLPVIGRLQLDSLRARFLRGLAHAVQAGLPLPEALRLSADATGSRAGAAEAEGIARQIEGGGTAMEATRATRFVPPILGYVLSVSAAPEDTRHALIQLAESYTARAEHTQMALRTWLPPIAICVVGAFIALNVLGLFLPLVKIIESVSG